MALMLPPGRKRGTKKQESPPGAWASIRKASHIGADMNHLCPVRRNSPPPGSPTGSARVVLARTSVPPCFSVMPMPMVTPYFSAIGRNAGSYSRDRIFGSHTDASEMCFSAISGATQAWVMVMGQRWPGSTSDIM